MVLPGEFNNRSVICSSVEPRPTSKDFSWSLNTAVTRYWRAE